MKHTKPLPTGAVSSTHVEILTPAMSRGGSGIPCILRIGEHRFASSVPKDELEAKLINETVQQIGDFGTK